MELTVEAVLPRIEGYSLDTLNEERFSIFLDLKSKKIIMKIPHVPNRKEIDIPLKCQYVQQFLASNVRPKSHPWIFCSRI